MASGTIGKLSVVLTARTAGFQTAMKKAADVTARIGKFAATAAVGVAGLGAAALTAAAGGVAALAKQQLAATDALAKNADRIGISTEALAGLEHAGELAGISAETMSKSLQRLNRNLGEAKTGIGPAAEALASLGLSADELASMPVDKAMGVIADSLNGVSNQAEKSRLAFDLLGRDGITLFSLMQGGSAGLAEAADEAARLGLSVSRIDAAQIEAANDAMTRASRVFTGIGRQVAVAVAPAIELAATKFSEWAQSGSGVGGKVTAAMRAVLMAVAFVADGVENLIFGVQSLNAVWLDWKATAIQAIADVVAAASRHADIIAGILGVVSPVAGAAFSGAVASSAGLQQTAAVARSEAGQAALAIGSPSGLGGRIRDFAAGIGAPGSDSDNRRVIAKQEETIEAVEELTAAVERQTDTLADALGRLSAGDTSSLFRALDRVAILIGSQSGRALAGVAR